MKHTLKTGFSFGTTSGVITTLGLMVGLHAGTHSKLAVIGGVLTIAIADAFSDAMGIHMSEESENTHTKRELWESAFFTFLFKFIFACSFLIPILLFSLQTAMVVSIGWGLLLVSLLSFYLAKSQKTKPSHMILEHIIGVIIVVAISHVVGDLIRDIFG
jgi:VIT1/CCC1 family predicted Fe2+/Mn2+ transporter